MLQNYVESNLRKLTELLRKQPMATHVLLRREDGILVDIPLLQAETKIRQKGNWVLEEVAGGPKPLETREDETVTIPPKPSEVSAGHPGFDPWQKDQDLTEQGKELLDAAATIPPKPSETLDHLNEQEETLTPTPETEKAPETKKENPEGEDILKPQSKSETRRIAVQKEAKKPAKGKKK